MYSVQQFQSLPIHRTFYAYAEFGILVPDSFVATSDIYGRVEFTQYEGSLNVTITFEIMGLSDGLHGFHVHERPYSNYGTCEDCGGHFNGGRPIWSPTNLTGTVHGNHVGDLCFNIHSRNGRAYGNFIDQKVSLLPGSLNNIIGRSIMVHEDPDDLGYVGDIKSLTTGNAGRRLACANINYI